MEPGKYIVAVSGGVDSVVLLDALHKHGKTNFQQECVFYTQEFSC